MQSAHWIKKELIAFICIISVSLLQAQSTNDTTNTKKKKVSFEKSIFVGTDFNDHLLIGFSGPQLMFSINEQTKIGPCY
jgi:hypothetical protein